MIPIFFIFKTSVCARKIFYLLYQMSKEWSIIASGHHPMRGFLCWILPNQKNLNQKIVALEHLTFCFY